MAFDVALTSEEEESVQVDLYRICPSDCGPDRTALGPS